jgi:hypothetical protein
MAAAAALRAQALTRTRDTGLDGLARKLADYALEEAAAIAAEEKRKRAAPPAVRKPASERKREIRADGTIVSNLSIEQMRACEISDETARRIRRHAELLERQFQQKERLEKWHLR